MKRLEVLTSVDQVIPDIRCETVIMAIAANAVLRENTNYRIIGLMAWSVQNHFYHVARQLGVALECNVFPSEADTNNALDRADVVTCLYWPHRVEHSASTIKTMQRGKATIVTDVKPYSEIPDDCTVKIDPENEFRDLVFALNRLHSDVGLRQSMAVKSKQWADRAARYVPPVYVVSN